MTEPRDGSGTGDDLAESLLQGGPGIDEITFRTPATTEMDARMREREPDLPAGVAPGITLFKSFPAVPAGGLALPRSVAAPFNAFGRGFMPTGFVSAGLSDRLAERTIAANGDSWIATRRAIADDDWPAIRDAARTAVATAPDGREGD